MLCRLLADVLTVVFKASDRHAYDWERCLEQCRLLLSDADEIFSSVSSSAVCHEIEAVDAGRSYLSGMSDLCQFYEGHP